MAHVSHGNRNISYSSLHSAYGDVSAIEPIRMQCEHDTRRLFEASCWFHSVVNSSLHRNRSHWCHPYRIYGQYFGIIFNIRVIKWFMKFSSHASSLLRFKRTEALSRRRRISGSEFSISIGRLKTEANFKIPKILLPQNFAD